MKIRHWLLMLFALLWVAMPCALAEGNLIQNGDFSIIGGGGNPDGWSRDMWDIGLSELRTMTDSDERGAVIEVINLKPNDARYSQTISVLPETRYRISGLIKAAGIDEIESDAGASIAVKDTFVSTDYIYDTNGEWQAVSFLGETAPDQYELTIMCRLGDYGALSEGSAWFDDISVEVYEGEYDPYEVLSLETVPPQSGNGFALGEAADPDAKSNALKMTLLVIAVLIYIAVAVALFWFVERGRLKLSQRSIIVGMIALGALIRIIVALCIRGYEVDINCFEAWSSKLFQQGLSNFYEADYFCDYPPGYLYVLWFVGGLRSLFGTLGGARLDWLLVKLPPMLMDFGMGYMLYRALRKRSGEGLAALLMGLCILNPAHILNSAAWGQIDVFLAAMLCATVLFAMDDEWQYALPIFAISVLVKPQALMFAPLGLIAVIMRVVRDENWKKQAVQMCMWIGLSLALMFFVSLPFLWGLDQKIFIEAGVDKLPGIIRPVAWLIARYTNTLGSYAHITVNACNLYTLLDQNWTELATVPTLSNTATILMIVSYCYAAFCYVWAKDIKKLPICGAMVLMLMFCLGPMMHERYLFPVLSLLLIAYSIDRDVRIGIAFLLVTFTQFMNVSLVLMHDHLRGADQILNAGLSLLNIVTAGLLSWTGFDLCVRDRAMAITKVYHQINSRARALSEAKETNLIEGIFRPRNDQMKLKMRDWLAMGSITLVYALIALVNLGSMSAPQSVWMSTDAGEQVTFDLGEIREFHLSYFGSSFNDKSFTVEFSEDGEIWTTPYYAEYNMGQIFRWRWYEPMTKGDNGQLAPLNDVINRSHPLHVGRFVRLTMDDFGLKLNEIAFVGADGKPLPVSMMQVAGGASDDPLSAAALLDEQETVPPYPSYFYGTYFDEIYHARTGFEHLHGLHTYEDTHPPLGKVLIMLGIKIFGMTPFGWRFPGALFGILMIPLIYLMARQLFRSTLLSGIAALLMAMDLMHFTQTRIATIDSFAVFFIMLMYLFMFRYVKMSYFKVSLWKTLIPLGLCGISMGLAVSSKWIGAYGGVGLAILFFGTVVARLIEYYQLKSHLHQIDSERLDTANRIIKLHWPNQIITLLWCVLFFVVIPSLIYYFSFYWQLTPDGNFTIRGVLDAQESMFGYHADQRDPHSFQSPWYQWPIIAWPMWYYTGNDFMQPGMVSSISCMGNPAVFWVGLLAIVFVLIRQLAYGADKLWCYQEDIQRMPYFRADIRFTLIAIGFLSQYLPWVLVPRSTFIYHYFASVPFIILATVLCLSLIRKQNERLFRILALALCAAAVVLFAFFYPIASGTPFPLWYARLTRWFGWINY